MQKMKVIAQFYDPLPPCAKIFSVIENFAPPPLPLNRGTVSFPRDKASLLSIVSNH